MSHRVSHVMSVNVSAGIFTSFEEAVAEAEAIVSFLDYHCKKNGYSCKAIVGISKNNPRAGKVQALHTGTRGRPRTIFVRTNPYCLKPEVPAHIHIVMYANPATTIVEMLKKHLRTKYKRKVTWENEANSYVEESIEYLAKQSLAIRKLDCDKAGILNNDKLGFYKAIEAVGDNRLKFRKSAADETARTLVFKGISQPFVFLKTLPCNIERIYILLLNLILIIKYILNVHIFNGLYKRLNTNISSYILKELCYLIKLYIPP